MLQGWRRGGVRQQPPGNGPSPEAVGICRVQLVELEFEARNLSSEAAARALSLVGADWSSSGGSGETPLERLQERLLSAHLGPQPRCFDRRFNIRFRAR